jgi:hypothetical protein
MEKHDTFYIIIVFLNFIWEPEKNALLHNYTNAGFWLVNSRDIFFLQIQALHCEFAEFLLHVSVFA